MVFSKTRKNLTVKRVTTKRRDNRRMSGHGYNNIANISRQLSGMSLQSPNYISELTRQFLEYKAKIESAVALDCEMVGVGSSSALAHIAIVDFNGNEIYNKYVIPMGGINAITDYRTRYSGITRNKLNRLDKVKHSFPRVKREVHDILKNRMIVGHGLVNDFKVLEFVPNPELVWDTTEINAYKQNSPYGSRRPRKLKALAMEFAGNNIQTSEQGGHSPLEDARASMNLYRLSLGYPKVHYTNMSR
jgi:hypothetical protein